jgi:hypothetical protein
VRSYLDCGWLSTDILKRNSLDTPDDADVVIGYLFMVGRQKYMVMPLQEVRDLMYVSVRNIAESRKVGVSVFRASVLEQNRDIMPE